MSISDSKHVTVPHALHAHARCPYHPRTGTLTVNIAQAPSRSPILLCKQCGRQFEFTDGIYCLMPDEFRNGTIGPNEDDPDVVQKKREMRQRDERVNPIGFVRVPQSSPLYWMNIQYDAVTRRTEINPSGVCIDFGAGVGRYTPWLLERVQWLIATDFSLASLQSLQARLTPEQRARCLLIQCDLSRLPIADDSATTALCIEVLQHLPSSFLRAAALSEIARTMTCGSEFFLVTKAHAPANRFEQALRRAKTRLRRLFGSDVPMPTFGQETQDGPIYTYWHRFGELQRVVQAHFNIRDARGIISYASFPIRFLNHRTRLALDSWLEKTPFGRWFGRDYFFRLVKPQPVIPIHQLESELTESSVYSATVA